MNQYQKIAIIVVIAVVVALAAYKNMHKRDAASVMQTQMDEQRNADMLAQDTGVAISEQADVQYYGKAKGFYAAPADMTKSYPGIVMVHEWWGLNDYIKDMARQLAKQGYQVLAVDMYSGEVTADPARAGTLAGGVRKDVPGANKNLRAATEYLREQKAAKIAALGWCFGGGQALNLALSGEKLDATVIYYGTLTDNKTELAQIKWPVLGVFGDKDTAVPVDSVRGFDKALDDLKITNDINIYPGVGHAFANPSGMNYAANETKDAWAKTLTFLKENLK